MLQTLFVCCPSQRRQGFACPSCRPLQGPTSQRVPLPVRPVVPQRPVATARTSSQGCTLSRLLESDVCPCVHLAQRPLRERRDLLRRSIVPKPSYCAFARGADFNVLPAGTELAVQVTTHRGGADAVSVTVPAISLQDSVSAEMASAVSSGCEGLMVKALSGAGSTYIPGSRTKAWLKLKQDYAGMAGGDTLDVVPIAG